MSKSLYDQKIIFSFEGMEGLQQTVAFTASSASSTAISTDEEQTQVLLSASQDCHVRSTKTGESALVTDQFIPSGVAMPFLITKGNIISVIQNSASGDLHISPVV